MWGLNIAETTEIPRHAIVSNRARSRQNAISNVFLPKYKVLKYDTTHIVQAKPEVADECSKLHVV